MKEYFDDLYKSVRDSIVDNSVDPDLGMDRNDFLMDDDEAYYNATVRNFIASETFSILREVADIECKFGRKASNVVTLAEGIPVLDDVQVPEKPEGALDVDVLIDVALDICSKDVQESKELKNEITFVKDELEEAGLLYNLNGYNQVGLDMLEKLRDSIIMFYNEQMTQKNIDILEK